MKIAFDIGEPSERGTTTAAFDYAYYGQRYCNFTPLIMYNDSKVVNKNALARFAQCFETMSYRSEPDKAVKVRDAHADAIYKLAIRKEENETVSGVCNLQHIVFGYVPPKGDVCAYISQWLAAHASGSVLPFVPHIVTMPEAQGDMRHELGIPEECTVVARYGGFEQFDIDFVQRTVAEVVDMRKDIYFIFANTKEFFFHPRIKYLPVLHGLEDKARFIATSDLMLHGRRLGESFGLAMAEFLSLGRPVLTWAGGVDRNHVLMQPNKRNIYKTGADLRALLLNARRRGDDPSARAAVAPFKPEAVCRNFENVFLKNLGCAASTPHIPFSTKVVRRFKNVTREKLNAYYERR